jgi:glycosyltransferase involved in cell wall biosynthesis
VVIPNGLDLNRFQPTDKHISREKYGLPQDKKLILYGAKSAASDHNKGFHLLTEALRHIGNTPSHNEIELVVFGSEPSEKIHECNLKAHFLGWMSNENDLATLYAAADVFVFPSLQESLGYTAMESMACGTPCVAFDQGGVPDLIDHKVCGYLAKPYKTEDLAQGILWILEDQDRYKSIVAQSRKKIEREFAIEMIAEKHRTLYTELLHKSQN